MCIALKMKNAIMKPINKLISIPTLIFIGLLSLNCAGNGDLRKNNKARHTTANKSKIIDIYRIEAAYRVREKWSMPKNSGCSNNSITSLFFDVVSNGEIKNIYYVDKSECEALNESAFMAVMEAAPFEPFPKILDQNKVKVGLRFSPEGIQ